MGVCDVCMCDVGMCDVCMCDVGVFAAILCTDPMGAAKHLTTRPTP